MAENSNSIELIRTLISEDEGKELYGYFVEQEIPEQAYIIEHLPEEEKIYTFALLKREEQAELIPELDDYSLEIIIRSLDSETLTDITDLLDIDEAVDLIGEVRKERREEILEEISRSAQIKALLEYGPETAAGLMTLKFLALRDTRDVKHAQDKLKKMQEEEEFKYIYIVGKGGKLIGYTTPWRILTSPAEKELKNLAKEIHAVEPDIDQERVATIAADFDQLQVPVVNASRKLIGVITIDDLVDVLEEEATEDIQHLGGIKNVESAFYPARRSFGHRIPWLYVKLLTALLAALVVGYYEEVIQAFIGAAIFMPVVAALGGGAGTQTLSIIVRAIALGEVKYNDVKRLLWKEFSVGILTGISVGIVSSFIAYIWKGNPLFGIIVGLALIINHIAAGIFGVVIPILLDRMGIDPAHASSILLTTFTDVFGFFVLLGLTEAIMI